MMVNIQHQAELAKKALDKQNKFESGWYEKRITRLEEKVETYKNRLEVCESSKEYSHGNNIILNKNLVLKFEEVDELHAAIRKYHRCLQAVQSNPQMLLSMPNTDEPARLMQAMYKAQSEMFQLAGVEYFGGYEDV